MLHGETAVIKGVVDGPARSFSVPSCSVLKELCQSEKLLFSPDSHCYKIRLSVHSSSSLILNLALPISKRGKDQ
jgi:hypothetical protein